jgi:hypothetical protein
VAGRNARSASGPARSARARSVLASAAGKVIAVRGELAWCRIPAWTHAMNRKKVEIVKLSLIPVVGPYVDEWHVMGECA